MSKSNISNRKYYQAGFAILGVLILIAASYCIKDEIYSDPPPTPGNSFQLTSSELQKLEVDANMGNTDAMWSLFNYYSMWIGDDVKADYWLVMAANSGDQQAKDVIAQLNKK